MILPDAVLLIGGGLLQTFIVSEILALGFTPLVTDRDPHAPAFKLAGVHPFVLDTYDVEEHRILVRDLQKMYTLCGVVTCGADVAPTVSAAAEEAHLLGLPFAVAKETHNKLAVRTRLYAAGLERYQPRWCTETLSGLQASHPFPWRHWGDDIVVKPLEQRASRGVSIVPAGSVKVFAAIEKALTYGDPHVLIEERLYGTEHSAEMLLDPRNQEPLWFNIVDRKFTYANGLSIETGHVNPTSLSVAEQQAIKHMLLEAAAALGVSWGPWKIDVMMTPEGPKILEVTARLSGGFDAQVTSPLTKRFPLRMLLQQACGLAVDAQTAPRGFAACAAVLPQKPGRVPTFRTDALWCQNLGVGQSLERVIWAANPGTMVHPASHNGERIGYVFAKAKTGALAWEHALAAATSLAASIEGERVC